MRYAGETVSAAAISIPHLAALHSDELHDAFEYLSLVYLDFFPFSNFRSSPASIAAYAGNGLDLREDYRDTAACAEEELNIPSQFALAVGYTHTSLTTSQGHISSACYIEETPTLKNLRLGYDARHEENYRDAVRRMLQSPMVDQSKGISPCCSGTQLRSQGSGGGGLQGVIDDLFGDQVEIVGQPAEFTAAKGVTELAKRAIFNRIKMLNTNSEL